MELIQLPGPGRSGQTERVGPNQAQPQVSASSQGWGGKGRSMGS